MSLPKRLRLIILVSITLPCFETNAQISYPPCKVVARTIGGVYFPTSGRVVDEKKEAMIGVVVQVKIDTVIVAAGLTDEEGNFHLVHRPPVGKASIRFSHPSYKTKEIALTDSGKPHLIQMELQGHACMLEFVDVIYRIPLINPWGPTQRSFTSEEIEKMAR